MAQVQLYEGKLPEAVWRDFQFAKVYNAEVKGQCQKVRDLKDKVFTPHGNIPIVTKTARDFAYEDSTSKSLYRTTLDAAVADILKQAEFDAPTLGIELVADLNVTQQHSFILKEPGGYRGILELRIEAIGYKRRTAILDQVAVNVPDQ